MDVLVNEENVYDQLLLHSKLEAAIFTFFRHNAGWRAITDHIGDLGPENALIDIPEEMVIPIRRGMGYDINFREAKVPLFIREQEVITIKIDVGYHHYKDSNEYPEMTYVTEYLRIPKEVITDPGPHTWHPFIEKKLATKPLQQQEEDLKTLRQLYQRHKYLGTLGMLNQLVEEDDGTGS